ncbi:MAG TPA: putative quinol monooxygenase [Tepidisphaeraceae bacterium]|nr:putative quinol monooxygenase [Tepidisphaeraceae bacterium]
MYVVIVTLNVKPESVAEFRRITLDNASNSRKEPGNLRFDVVCGEDDPTRFHFYEVYKTKEDFAYHQQQPYYFRWRDAVGALLVQPRSATRNTTVFYGESEA